MRSVAVEARGGRVRVGRGGAIDESARVGVRRLRSEARTTRGREGWHRVLFFELASLVSPPIFRSARSVGVLFLRPDTRGRAESRSNHRASVGRSHSRSRGRRLVMRATLTLALLVAAFAAVSSDASRDWSLGDPGLGAWETCDTCDECLLDPVPSGSAPPRPPPVPTARPTARAVSAATSCSPASPPAPTPPPPSATPPSSSTSVVPARPSSAA